MKKTIYGAAFLVIFVWLTYFFFGQQEIEREYVQVLNIEMLVRVMKDGRPLAGLQKGDFSLFENGQKQEINGFLEVHRRITPGETKEKAKAEKEARPGRLFLLFFWINEPAVKVGEVLNYFFNSIYREGDRVILADQRHSLEINSTAGKDARVAEFKAGLSVLSGDLLTARRRFKSDIEACLQLYITCLDAQNNTKYPPRCDPETVALQYAQLLKEYRMQNLTPNANQLEAMSRSLEAIDADKWALVFYQHDTLPLFNTEKLKLEDYHLRLGSTINSIDKVNRDLLFPVEASLLADSLRSRFIQTNTQFHLLLLDRQQTPTDVDPTSRFGVVNPFPVFSNWEKTFRQMAEATGGEIMDGNQMKEALDEVAGREDVYYVFTYAPTAGKTRERRIDIQVGREGVQVIHGRRLEMENLPQIRLAAIEQVPGKVHLDLENIYMIGRGGLRSGLVRVSLFATREKEYALARDMEIETTGSVEIPIGQLPPGKYRLAAQVVDCLTGLQVQGEATLDVLGGEVPAETSELLRLAAAYSERLRQAAFRFICQETVSEDVLARDTIDRSSHNRVRTSWLYEYQVVVRAGKVIENRVLLRKNRTKMHVENAALETRFRSLYSAFLPWTLFAAEKQPAFFYKVEKHEKMNGRQVARLAIAPRPGYEELGAGTAWVDEETGAVLKIELSQRAIKGVQAAEKQAQQTGARLLISDVHDYQVERDGIWLPSRTSISAFYVINVAAVSEKGGINRVAAGDRGGIKGGDMRSENDEVPEAPPPAKYVSNSGANRQIELSRTWVEYSDFRFFVVDVQTKEEQ